MENRCQKEEIELTSTLHLKNQKIHQGRNFPSIFISVFETRLHFFKKSLMSYIKMGKIGKKSGILEGGKLLQPPFKCL